MTFEFAIAAWSGCAAGLNAAEDWRAWAVQPQLPLGDEKSSLAEMPPLLRRRLSGVGRMAAQAAYLCEPLPSNGTPVVFASRYGDAVRSIDLLGKFAQLGEVSPTDFALSVHNAIGAVYSIARQDEANYIAVAGGPASAAAALMEAVSLLADGAAGVTVVCYDAVLPEPYGAFHSEPAAGYAWVWRVTKPEAGAPYFRLAMSSADECASAPPEALLPFGLDVMRFALSDDAALRREADGVVWTWTRHV
ncbi:MAG: hypothetical protein JWP29_1410 [Rhodoferax sp.]|nr:hypothetical protein [Rhodoferax sp.]